MPRFEFVRVASETGLTQPYLKRERNCGIHLRLCLNEDFFSDLDYDVHFGDSGQG